jgi:hypothetical protein
MVTDTSYELNRNTTMEKDYDAIIKLLKEYIDARIKAVEDAVVLAKSNTDARVSFIISIIAVIVAVYAVMAK